MPIAGCLALLVTLVITGWGVAELGWLGFILLLFVVRILWSILEVLLPTRRP